MPKYRSCVSALAAALSVLSCDAQPNDSQPTIATSDRSHDPGAEPTNLLSFELLSKAPTVRRAAFQKTLGSLEKQCQLVTEAVLKGGFEGTDLWRVSCADSGDWLVTFSPDLSVSATSCRVSRAECQAAWKSVSLDP